MSQVVYLNGRYQPDHDAKVSIYDRGFLMADAVYEVTCVLDGKLLDFLGHMRRLRRSLAAMKLHCVTTDEEFLAINRRLIADNRMADGMIYIQVSRGNPRTRDFVWPDAATASPTVVAFPVPKADLENDPAALQGYRVITVPDQRWARRDIKTVQLLYPSMAKMMALEAGADDAWMVEDGFITEATSSNAWIIRGNAVVTRPATQFILGGITRAAVLRLAEEAGLNLEERAFTREEALHADEAFITAATYFALPVIEIDGQAIGTGVPGPLTLRLRQLYIELARRDAI